MTKGKKDKTDAWKKKMDAYYSKTDTFTLAKDLKKAGFKVGTTKKPN